MEQKLIFYPMFVLIAWTYVVGMVQFSRAIRAVGDGLNPAYFRLKRGFEPPSYLLSASQHFSNLFEMPVLFYAAILTIYTAGITHVVLLVLAWVYVITRLLHSHHHLSNRNLLKRRNAFLASYFVLLVLWLGIMYLIMF